MKNTEDYLNIFKDLVFEYSTKFVAALLILVIGFWIIRRINLVVRKMMEKREIDPGLRTFLLSIMRIILKVLLIFTVLNQAGVNTTSFIAAIGAAGLAIGLALQGSLSNFAGGAIILFFKPFKIGDFIEAQGLKGNVKEIEIFVTKLSTPEGKLAIIPNGILANGNIVNFSEQGSIRVDVKIGISYGSDLKKAREVLMEVLHNHPDVLQEPKSLVGVAELGDSSVNLVIRAWAHPDLFWSVLFELTEQSKLALDAAGVKIPFPQREVRMLS